MFEASEPVIETATARLTELFGLCACWFESFPFDAQLPRIEPGRIVLPAAEPGVEPWSYGGGIELPVRFGDLTVGRFVLVPVAPTTGVGFAPAARAEAMAMAAAVGSEVVSALLNERAGGRGRG